MDRVGVPEDAGLELLLLRHLRRRRPCPYANVCETCDSSARGPEFAQQLDAQLETYASSRLTPNDGDGATRSPGTIVSPKPSKATFTGWKIKFGEAPPLDRPAVAG